MTFLERWLFILTCCLCVVLVIMVISLVAVLVDVSSGRPAYCASKECVRSAAVITGSMNRSADPCTDFYEFACGKWKNIAGDEEDSWERRISSEFIQQTSVELSKSNHGTKYEAVKEARLLYGSCMDIDALDSLGLEPLLDLLESVGLPRDIPNNKTAVDFDLSKTLARVHSTLGLPVLIDVIRESYQTFAIYTLPVEAPNIALFETIFAWVNRNRRLSVDIFRKDWEDFVAAVDSFASSLNELRSGQLNLALFNYQAKPLPPKMKWMRMPASKMTSIIRGAMSLPDETDMIVYDTYMEALLEGKKGMNWSLKDGTISLDDPEYHLFLAIQLQKYSKLHWQMFVWMEVVRHFGAYTTVNLRNRMKHPRAAVKSQTSWSESCAELVINLMPAVVEHLLAQIEPLKNVTEKVTAITQEIQKSQEELVQKAEWLDRSSLNSILKRLKDLKTQVGYIDWIVEGRVLDSVYDRVVFRGKEFLRSISHMQARQAEMKLLISTPMGLVKRGMMFAAYFRTTNTVAVSPMVMRFPFYPLGLEALNYGAMGLLIAREFGHALDARALMAGDYFSLKPAVFARVDSFVNCTKNRIKDLSKKLNGEAGPDRSISEETSDINGVRLALHAFQKNRRGSELPLPGLETFTDDQLFFLAFGNLWCNNGKLPGPGEKRSPLISNRVRVLSVAMNTPEFAQIWSCPSGRPMNPKDKCALF